MSVFDSRTCCGSPRMVDGATFIFDFFEPGGCAECGSPPRLWTKQAMSAQWDDEYALAWELRDTARRDISSEHAQERRRRILSDYGRTRRQ